jgi:1A family penicillin-binding protein
LAPAVFAQDNYASYPPLPASLSSTNVVDAQGRYVGRILPQKRYWVTLDHIPAFLQQAVVAVEDARFYEHGGIDLRGIARALLKDMVKGRAVEGGSTITQQLIKNKYLSSEVSLDRKLKEARMAIEFEKKYTKQQILEMYFNEIYFGNGVWGIAQASRLYFDKSPLELTDSECLLLAGIPKNPGRYNPWGKPADVAGRRDVVLKRMLDLGRITDKQRRYLLAHPAKAHAKDQAPNYLAQIRTKLTEQYGEETVELGGLEVTAALNLDLQKAAEKALESGVKRISPDLQGALICLDATTGDVLAAVGGLDSTQTSLNRAFAARRQPGSAIKPLIYAAALERGITASSQWNDAPVAYNRGNGRLWKPLNFGREQYGALSLRQALAVSNNVITVKLLDTIGVPYFADFAGKMGVPIRAQNGLSLALGTDDVTLNELVQAYTPFASGGTRVEARTILRIQDRKRGVTTENPPTVSQVLAPATAFVTTQMLKDVLLYGTAKGLRKFSQEHPSAGKTGTTDDEFDAWFIGYTPKLVTGIWVGYDHPRSGGKGFTGGQVAAPIWERFMRAAVKAKPAEDFPQPEGVVAATIDPTTGYLATAACPTKLNEYYLVGTAPAKACPEHGGEALTPVVPPELPPLPEPEAETGTAP